MKILLALILLFSFNFSSAQKAAAPDLRLYGIKLTERNTVVLRGEVNDSSMANLAIDLAAKVAQRAWRSYPIYLVLDSPGGSIYAGKMFTEFLQTQKNISTVTIFAASMASAIVQANPGPRYIISNGIMMFHRATGQFRGQFAEGEIESQLRMVKAMVLSMELVNANRMGLTIADYKNQVKDELWHYGAEAVQNKSADYIVRATCDQDLINKRVEVEQQSIFGKVTTLMSGCPLITGAVLN